MHLVLQNLLVLFNQNICKYYSPNMSLLKPYLFDKCVNVPARLVDHLFRVLLCIH